MIDCSLFVGVGENDKEQVECYMEYKLNKFCSIHSDVSFAQMKTKLHGFITFKRCNFNLSLKLNSNKL